MTAPRWQQQALLAFLALAQVCAQAYGLQHRIEHRRGAGWADTALAATPLQAGDATHACAAIDALALGDAPPLAATPTLPRALPPLDVAADAPSTSTAAPAAPFRARAPPHAV
jgi:hypothetical protein